MLDILFSSNHNIHKSSCGLCFWDSDPLIENFYKNISIKGSEAQKQRPHELIWILWFDKKSISNVCSAKSFSRNEIASSSAPIYIFNQNVFYYKYSHHITALWLNEGLNNHHPTQFHSY